MCRFVVFQSNQSILLKEILADPVNSLIKQSRFAKFGKHGLNADGFGIGWYDHEIDELPGLYRSTQPAWNDHNLSHLVSKIKSDRFIGHVRSSTVGDVNVFNCHPFSYNKYLFCHNGTIHGFELIQRHLQNQLSDKAFNLIKGQTDSEHLFALMMDSIFQLSNEVGLSDLESVVLSSFAKIEKMQSEFAHDTYSRLNIVITDGENLIVTRYSSRDDIEPLSLYYAIKEWENGIKTVLIASEPLDENAKWECVPENHMILINENLDVTFKALAF